MRRQVLVVVILCGLLLSLRAQTQTANTGQNPALSTQCATKNPFLAVLKSQGVTIYSSPQVGSQKCGKEWASFGSCCEESTLINYVNNDQQTVLNRFLNIHMEYIKFKGRMDKQILKSSTQIQADLKDVQAQSKAILSNLEDQGFYTCPDTLSRVRSSGLCDTCSGRSERYFTADKFAQLSLWDCKAVIDSCSMPWKVMANMVNMISQLTDILQKYKITISGADIRADVIKQTVSWLKEIELEKLLTDCNCSATKCDCKPDNAKKLCDNLISLAKDPISIVPTLGSSDPSQSSTSLWGRRLLQLLSKTATKTVTKIAAPTTTVAAPTATTAAAPVQKTTSTVSIQLAGDVRVVTTNFTESGPNSSMDLSLNFP